MVVSGLFKYILQHALMVEEKVRCRHECGSHCCCSAQYDIIPTPPEAAVIRHRMSRNDGDAENDTGIFAADGYAQREPCVDVVSKPRLFGDLDGKETNDEGKKSQRVVGPNDVTKINKKRIDGGQKYRKCNGPPLTTQASCN